MRTLRRLPELGVNFVDTADSYGPEVSENLIREALHPFHGMLIATKGGMVRHGPGKYTPVGRPEYLRQCVLMSLRRLEVERIDLWQLHRIDPKVPREEQFDVIREMQNEDLIRHAGLSQVTVEDIEAAQRYFRVATVQSLYNLVDRSSENVLEHCAANGIGFIPFMPLSAGQLATRGSLLDTIARTSNVNPSQIALAWLLKRSPAMLPIPGTGGVKHLEENVAAASISLSEEDVRALDVVGRKVWHNGL